MCAEAGGQVTPSFWMQSSGVGLGEGVGCECAQMNSSFTVILNKRIPQTVAD